MDISFGILTTYDVVTVKLVFPATTHLEIRYSTENRTHDLFSIWIEFAEAF